MLCLLAVLVVVGVGAAIKFKVGVTEGKRPGGELSDSIYTDGTL